MAPAWAVPALTAAAWALRAAVWACLAASAMLVAEAAYMGLASLVAVAAAAAAMLWRWRRPDARYRWEPMPMPGAGGRDDVEAADFPMVLVQIPMYNEREVYKLSIAAACALTWPPDRIVIQVLDDSTDPIIKELVELECQDWATKKVNIKYEVRDNRKGYKAGALKKGMEHIYAKQCDFVAIFDADFQPEPDFLLKTIPFLVHNPKIALVQARWEFVNYDVCLMTRIQKMSLDYHFKVEQESGSFVYSFFGFNGTAGVWRVSAINQSGGWKDRTTVEDMDLAVRASLKGWEFLYVGDIKVDYACTPEEVQQHFNSCGTVNRVTILTDKFGQPKGFAYVEFVEVEAVQEAVKLNESELHGRQLKVAPKRTNVPGMKQPRGRGFNPYHGHPYMRPYGYSPYGYGRFPRFRRPRRPYF